MNIAVVGFQSAFITLGRAPQYHPTIIMEPLWMGAGEGQIFLIVSGTRKTSFITGQVRSQKIFGKYRIQLWFIPITASYTLW